MYPKEIKRFLAIAAENQRDTHAQLETERENRTQITQKLTALEWRLGSCWEEIKCWNFPYRGAVLWRTSFFD